MGPWTENRGAPKTRKTTMTDPTPHSRPSDQNQGLSSPNGRPSYRQSNSPIGGSTLQGIAIYRALPLQMPYRTLFRIFEFYKDPWQKSNREDAFWRVSHQMGRVCRDSIVYYCSGMWSTVRSEVFSDEELPLFRNSRRPWLFLGSLQGS